MDRILVATDFSTRSDRAMRRAALISAAVGAKIIVAHVVDGDQPDALIETDRAAASSIRTDLVSTLRSEGVDADWTVKVDDVHAGILSAAAETSADLIVIGPHRSRFRDIFIGTTAERVTRLSTRPLLVAVETPGAHHRKTLLAIDFDEASEAAGRAALAMGIFDRTDVVVMHAFDAPAEGMLKRSLHPSADVSAYVETERETADGDLRMLLANLGLPETCQTVVSMKGSPARTILELAREIDCDLIVLGTNQRKGFERALVGSVTADVIRDAHRDVLIVPVDELD
jgi:nucleotide-binding universal stress UspA family protein